MAPETPEEAPEPSVAQEDAADTGDAALFTLNEADYRAFVIHYFTHVPGGRRHRRLLLALGGLGVACLLFIEAQDARYEAYSDAVRIGVFAGAFIVFLALYEVFLRRALPMMATWAARRGAGRGMFRKTTVTLESDGVALTTPDGRGLLPYEGIQRVDWGEEHLFIIVGQLRAFIVPRRVLDADQEARWREALAPWSAGVRPASPPSSAS